MGSNRDNSFSDSLKNKTLPNIEVNEKILLRYLPSVDMVIRDRRVQEFIPDYSQMLVTDTVREVLNNLRKEMLKGLTQLKEDQKWKDRESILNWVVEKLEKELLKKAQMSLRAVINATGVVLHTNLGRARLGESAKKALQEVAGSYSNLEMDLATGKRGLRYSHTDELLKYLTGAEDSLVVNNNAAAVLLALNTLAKGKEVIVSRGELIEIGGSFRIPEVMDQSGAILREVGTTNKTYDFDYAGAINENTALLFKAHTSNYQIIGFTHKTTTEELVALGKEKELPVMVDLGSGLLFDLQEWKLPKEPLVRETILAGADVVTFSGDKLLGGPQAGIIVGKKKYLEQMKKNPLNRALRIDKLTLAALEATLREYLDLEKVIFTNPTLKMLTSSLLELEDKANRLAVLISEELKSKIEVKVVPGTSQVGGGSMPGKELPTWIVMVKPFKISAATIVERLRCQARPVLARIQEEHIIMDVRTIEENEFGDLIKAWKDSIKGVENVCSLVNPDI